MAEAEKMQRGFFLKGRLTCDFIDRREYFICSLSNREHMQQQTKSRNLTIFSLISLLPRLFAGYLSDWFIVLRFPSSGNRQAI